jgi:kynureninase
MSFNTAPLTAQLLDQEDELSGFRTRFIIPSHHHKPVVYLCGNSLGLQPRKAALYIQEELEDWGNLGVEGHFRARRPWFNYHELLSDSLSRLTGALPAEVVSMNQLTVNLHLLMVSFYRPQSKRCKIICEAKAFPSDQYAMQSQVAYHGYHPDECIIEVGPRKGNHHIETADILAAIEQHKDELALVLFSGVNYYSGQVFDMKSITEAGHKASALVGFDLAHAIGNVQLSLHDWGVDFATWCSYKYLNSGPGGVSGIFVHERHLNKTDIPRFHGWWGHDPKLRFKMEKEFVPMATAEAWQMSNAPILSMAAHKASLEIFDEAGMDRLQEKRIKLVAYMEFLLQDLEKQKKFKGMFDIITPKERGCQLSILFHHNGRKMFDHLTNAGVIADWREPDVIRVAPVPLYNSFMDVYQFYAIMKNF